MNELPQNTKTSHVIELHVPALTGQGKALLAVLALGVAVFAGWAVGHHASVPVNTVGMMAAPVATPTQSERIYAPTPAALPEVQTPVTLPREAAAPSAPTTITSVVPAVQTAAPVVPAPPAPKQGLTARQQLNDAIENQAAATGQSPAEVIQSLSPSNSQPASPTVITAAAPAPQTVVVQTPAPYPYYSAYYGYGYPYYYGYGPYVGYPYARVGFSFNFGHGGGWHGGHR